MDSLEKIGYICLSLLAILYGAAMLFGMIASFPLGLIGLVAIIGFGALFIKVLKERLNSREDDHYSKNVEK